MRRLITDADVLARRVTSPLVLDEGTLLTPSARDRCLSRGIVVVERGASPPPTASPAASSSGCACGRGACGGCGAGRALDGLPDGTYLIVVRDGRVVSTLPNTGPGLMPRVT